MRSNLVFFAALASVLLFGASGAAQAAKCKTGDPYPYESAAELESCPADIQEFLDALNACTHFEQEVGDRQGEDKAEALRQMEKLGCADIGCRYESLFAKYEGDVVYTRIFADYVEMLSGPEGELKCESKPGDE